jgi:predicted DNA-binding ribbon-helix-helix protein
MKSAVIKRSIFINGKKTSISLENEFWNGLQEIAKNNNTTVAELSGQIARQRNTVNLSSAIRIYVFNHFRKEGAALGADPAQPHMDSRSLRARVGECRALAETFKAAEARTAMLMIAEDYERMAANAERLERATKPD